MGFNRKERLKMVKKIGRKSRPNNAMVHFRMTKIQRKEKNEAEMIRYAEERIRQREGEKMVDSEQYDFDGNQATTTQVVNHNQYKGYTLSIALPGSILNNAQGPEFRTYLAGQIARTCAIFCVDEVIVFDESAQITDSQIDAYYSGAWNGNEKITSDNTECNFHLARLLEYLECPQYLRKHLFPIQRPLKFSGVLNPLDGMHHLRASDLSIPYREGVVLDKYSAKGIVVDVGLQKELEIPVNSKIPPWTRVTVKLDYSNSKHLAGEISNPQQVAEESGIYWGYSVRIAKSLTDALKNQDIIIGTSERGTAIGDTDFPKVIGKRVLIVFGGLAGLESAVDADEKIKATDPADVFPIYINTLPGQGSRVIRTEEAIPITLTTLRNIFTNS
uniref:RNA methyltransferase n=1 Tax=Panagrolaimus sp. JU765 TaxID=591449 RepID=A0AC34RQU6_9BILA